MNKKESRFDIQGDSLSGESKTFLWWYEDELEAQSERIAEEKEIENEEALDKFLGKLSYLKGEYIVDGALLTCSKCIKEKTTLKYKGEIIDCEFNQEEKRKRIHILDERSEKINGLIPVNLKDCKGGLRDDKEKDERVNIVSMGNCGFLYEGEDIEEIIRESGSSNTPEEVIEALGKGMGTCYCFMDLNEVWENMPLEIADAIVGYKRLPCAGAEEAFRMPSYFKFNGEEGINMMSMLFCQLGGGCITALESGQNNVGMIINVKEKILELLKMENGIELVAKYLEEVKSKNPDYVCFLEKLAMRESQGGYNIHNDGSQYLGRYQIGRDVFQQIGFKDENDNWTELAELLNVKDDNDFLESEIAQEVAILFAIRWDYQSILVYQDNQHIGKTIEGVYVTNSGLVAAGHLIGCKKLHKAFVGTIPWSEAVDGKKTSALVYMKEMGGLDLSGVLGGIE